MVIKDKWKVFAFLQMVSSWDNEKYTALEAYNALMDASYEDLPSVFTQYDISVWCVFEDYETTEFTDMLADLADAAQRTDDLP